MTALANNCNSRRTSEVLLRFNRPANDFVHRAYDHLIAVRRGVTLMVPVSSTSGRLLPMVDLCPVPWLEASAILSADYLDAQALDLVALARHAASIYGATSSLASYASDVMESFFGGENEVAIALTDKDWRHMTVTLSQGGEPCRVLIGAAGVRLAFTPDFLEGLL